MEWWQWVLWSLLAGFYIMCIFTVCMLTFQKGRTVLGILGIFFPFLWLIGAILPAKRGSRFELAQGMAAQSRMEQMTS